MCVATRGAATGEGRIDKCGEREEQWLWELQMMSVVVMIKNMNFHDLLKKQKASQAKSLHSCVCGHERSGCWRIDRYEERGERWLWEKQMLHGVVMRKNKNSWSVEKIKKHA